MLTRIGRFLAGSMRSWRLPRSELLEMQEKKLRYTLTEAYHHIPLYKARLDAAKVVPERIQREDFTKVPMLTKADIMTNFPAGITRNDLQIGRRQRGAGSGTSGVPMRVVWSDEMMDVRDALLVRRLVKFGVRPWLKTATVWPPNAYWRRLASTNQSADVTTVIGESPFTAFVGGKVPILSAIRTDPKDLARAARRFMALRPDFVMGRASVLRRVGQSLGKGDHRPQVRALLCGNEFFTAAVARELEELYGGKVLVAYGGSEFGVVGGECAAHRGIHLNEDYLVCEVMTGTEPTKPGEVGELIITSLHNRVMPFIRYRTGDLARVARGGVCGCGSSLMRVEAILGRASDSPVAKDGRRIPSLEVANRVESETTLRDYQISQEGPDELVVKLPREQLADTGAIKQAVDILEGMLGRTLKYSVKARQEEDIWNKNRPIVCKLP